MRLRFIGTDGSLGLRHGRVYDVSFNSHRGRVYVTSPVHCPYASDVAFWRNWQQEHQQGDNVRRVQELRRSSASSPVPSGRAYRRRPKHPAPEE